MTDERCFQCELSLAASRGDVEALRLAIREGADPGSDSDCNTALFDAIEQDSAESIAVLLAGGADSSRAHPMTGQTPLAAALEGERLGAVRELARREVDPGSVSLARLVRDADRPEIVGLAVSAGVEVDSVDPETGRTALHEASIYGYLSTVKCLLDLGAEKEALDDHDNTAATYARRNHHSDVSQLLADGGSGES